MRRVAKLVLVFSACTLFSEFTGAASSEQSSEIRESRVEKEFELQHLEPEEAEVYVDTGKEEGVEVACPGVWSRCHAFVRGTVHMALPNVRGDVRQCWRAARRCNTNTSSVNFYSSPRVICAPLTVCNAQ